MDTPLVSVVMSVRNGGFALLETIQSILDQQNIDFEFIIIDDGSSDNTRSVLTEIANKDSRIRLLLRKGRGLTISLIEGCSLARGEFIARQDAFDYSLANRLWTQAQQLKGSPDASMCSSYVSFITTERVVALTQTSSEAIENGGLSGVIHGSTMFRKVDYLRVGGYRQQFYYAQDVDLWSRLVEVGNHIIIPEILYENCIYPNSISGSRRKEQIVLHRLIRKATRARRCGEKENKWLIKASKYSEKCKNNTKGRVSISKGAYFIGSCLIKTHPLLAKKYLQMSIKSNPLNIRARFKILGIK